MFLCIIQQTNLFFQIIFLNVMNKLTKKLALKERAAGTVFFPPRFKFSVFFVFSMKTRLIVYLVKGFERIQTANEIENIFR